MSEEIRLPNPDRNSRIFTGEGEKGIKAVNSRSWSKRWSVIKYKGEDNKTHYISRISAKKYLKNHHIVTDGLKDKEILKAVSYTREGKPIEVAKTHLSPSQMQEAAMKGDVHAQVKLGEIYSKGIGVKKNQTEAKKYYKLAALQGNAEAQNALGDIYYNNGSHIRAFKYYAEAANQGHAEAQRSLGVAYIQKTEFYSNSDPLVNKYRALGYKYLKESAEQGNARGQRGLGYCYHYGVGVERDFELCIKYYRLSALQDDPVALERLGQLYYPDNSALAYIYIKEAVDKGQDNWITSGLLEKIKLDGEICNKVGQYYYQGKEIKQDYEKAYEYFQKSADLGDPNGQCNLGRLYELGRGVKQDYDLAYDFYEKAANKGNPSAENLLGRLYRDGIGVEKNLSVAFSFFEKAANKGLAYAQFNLADLYYYEKDFIKAEEWYLKAAKQGHPDAQGSLGYLYQHGEGEVAANPSKALKWTQKAADQHHPKALYALGEMYANGIGVKQDLAQAEYYFNESAKYSQLKAERTLKEAERLNQQNLL